MEASSSTAPPPSKAPRSQFLQKLHSILENPLDPNGLRWVTDDSFEISSKDAVAIHALSPAFEFHSLSSFIRQLSYYSFRRLSDRRRSTERRNSNPGYVLFQHPSGFFVRGDPSQLAKIVRKARTRPEKGRRASECSTASDEAYPSSLHPYPMPTWPPSTDYRSSFSSDRPTLQLPSFGSSFNPLASPSRSSSETTQWRAYAPTTGAWVDPHRGDGDRFGPPRRSSLGEFKLAPSSMLAGEPSGYSSTLSSLQEENRPRARKASTSSCMPHDEPHHHHAYLNEHPSSQHAIAQGFSASPYPTPTFSPTTNTFFEAAPSSSAQSHGYHHSAGPSSSAFVSASHMAYEPSPFASSYHPIASSKGGAHSYHTPSPDQSPLQEVVGLPGLVETVPPIGHPAHPSSSATNGGDYGQAQHGDRHASPRPSVSYAPLAPLQTRYAASPSSISGLTHAPWQPSQAGQGYSTPTSAGLSSQPYGFAPPPPPTAAPHSQSSQWSPAPIRHSAY